MEAGGWRLEAAAGRLVGGGRVVGGVRVEVWSMEGGGLENGEWTAEGW